MWVFHFSSFFSPLFLAPLLLASYMQTYFYWYTFFVLIFKLQQKTNQTKAYQTRTFHCAIFYAQCACMLSVSVRFVEVFWMQFQCIYEILNNMCVYTSEYLFERISEYVQFIEMKMGWHFKWDRCLLKTFTAGINDLFIAIYGNKNLVQTTKPTDILQNECALMITMGFRWFLFVCSEIHLNF